jgi:hypothetical protein
MGLEPLLGGHVDTAVNLLQLSQLNWAAKAKAKSDPGKRPEGLGCGCGCNFATLQLCCVCESPVEGRSHAEMGPLHRLPRRPSLAHPSSPHPFPPPADTEGGAPLGQEYFHRQESFTRLVKFRAYFNAGK